MGGIDCSGRAGEGVDISPRGWREWVDCGRHLVGFAGSGGLKGVGHRIHRAFLGERTGRCVDGEHLFLLMAMVGVYGGRPFIDIKTTTNKKCWPTT